MRKTRKIKYVPVVTSECLETVITLINGSNRTLVTGREVSLHKEQRVTAKGGRYRLTHIEREADGRILLTVFGPLSSVKPKQLYVRPEDIKALHFKPQKTRTALTLVTEKVCDNCLAAACPGARGQECRERE